jgi:hypothetical protein
MNTIVIRAPAIARRRLWAGILLLCSLPLAGCQGFRHRNTAADLGNEFQPSTVGQWTEYFKNSTVVPVREVILLKPLRRAVFGDEAWNTDGDGVPDSSFYTNRRPEDLTPEAVARGPCIDSPPEPPFTILKSKPDGVTPGFIGKDAQGRKYVFKLDDARYPELGSGANIIASRIFWALGYNVPAEYIVTISGTGEPNMDGRRASASAFIENAHGHICFDCLRYRRELRGLGLAAAWVNDVDRNDTNTLVAFENGVARCYMVDFNSALGAWQGRPKEPWRGWKPAGHVPMFVVSVFTFGLVTSEPDPQQPIVSPAVGRFEAAHFRPLAWQPQWPNNAFAHMADSDKRWIASKIALLERSHLETIVAQAQYSDPADADYVLNTLFARRDKILDLAAPR